MLFLTYKKKHFHVKSDFSTKKNLFWVCFKPLKPPAIKQHTQGTWPWWGSFILCITHTRVGKRQVLLSEANHHWDLCFFTVHNIICNQETSSILFCGVGEIAIQMFFELGHSRLLFLLWIEGIFIWNQTSPQRRMCFNCVLSYWSPLQASSAHRTFGKCGPLSPFFKQA